MKQKIEILFDDIKNYFDNYPSQLGSVPKIWTDITQQKFRDNRFFENVYTDISATFIMDSTVLYYDCQRLDSDPTEQEKQKAYDRLYNSFLMYLLTVRLPIWKTSINAAHETKIK